MFTIPFSTMPHSHEWLWHLYTHQTFWRGRRVYRASDTRLGVVLCVQDANPPWHDGGTPWVLTDDGRQEWWHDAVPCKLAPIASELDLHRALSRSREADEDLLRNFSEGRVGRVTVADALQLAENVFADNAVARDRITRAIAEMLAESDQRDITAIRNALPAPMPEGY